MVDDHIFLANYSPVEGKREEFDQLWPIHVREVVENINGFVAGQRYCLTTKQRPWSVESPWECLVIYELKGDDVDAIHRDNTRVRDAELYTPFTHLVKTGHQAHVYSPVGSPYPNEHGGSEQHAPHIVVVRSNPSPGHEEAYNSWYETHIREVVDNIEGYVRAQRYRLNPSQRPGMVTANWKYIVIYELDGTDLDTVFRSNAAAKEADVFTPRGGLLKPDFVSHVFTATPPRVSPLRGV